MYIREDLKKKIILCHFLSTQNTTNYLEVK